MTSLDGLILATLVISGLISLVRGLIREVLSLLAYIVAVVGCLWIGTSVTQSLSNLIALPLLRSIAGYGLVFVVLMLVMSLINSLIVKTVHAAGLSDVDRGLGGIFGMARGLLLVMLFVVIGRSTPLIHHPAWQNSLFIPVTQTWLQRIQPNLPQPLFDFVR